MGKLFSLKEWLTVAATAQHLSIVFDEVVTEADVLRLVLDGRLRLSIYFVNSKLAHCGRRIPISEAAYKEVPSLEGTTTVRLYEGPVLYSDGVASQVLKLDRDLVALRGVYDLPLIGGEWKDIEQMYHDLINGAVVDSISIDGTFVEGRDGLICQLQEKYEDGDVGDEEFLDFIREINDDEKTVWAMESLMKRDQEKRHTRSREHSYFPAGELPNDGILVVRTDALREFEALVAGSAASSTLPETVGRREQQHEVILAVIAALSYDPLNIPDGGKAKIKAACLTRPRLFTSDSFDHAWKAGVGLFRMANHEKYSPK